MEAPENPESVKNHTADDISIKERLANLISANIELEVNIKIIVNMTIFI